MKTPAGGDHGFMAEVPPRDPRDPAEAETVIVERAEIPPPRRAPKLWPWLLALLLLVLGGLAAAYALTRDDDEEATPATTATTAATTSAEVGEVPVVVGMRILPAMERVFDAGFEADRVHRASAKPSGVVFEQEPKAGTELELGRTVRLFVSSGPPRETVPDVVGEPVSEAVSDLRAVGLDVKQVEAFGPGEQGTVLKQAPAGGKKLRKGATVTLTVSKGRQPAAVPDVAGQELADAARAFADEGLKVAVRYVPSNEAPGRVVAQAQPAGTELRRGDTVQLNVSTGSAPDVAASVPDVVGQRQDRGRSALEQARFEVLALNLETGQVRNEDEVASQSPAAGASIPRGSLVLLYVS